LFETEMKIVQTSTNLDGHTLPHGVAVPLAATLDDHTNDVECSSRLLMETL
jgi:hypothetical protein